MSQSPMQRFEDAWKTWARRDPSTAAPEAARRLRARLDAAPAPRSSRPGRFRPWLAAAAVALVAAGAWLSLRPAAPAPEPIAFGITEPQPLPPGVALLWLDAGTPLYMTLTPPPAAAPPGEKGDPP